MPPKTPRWARTILKSASLRLPPIRRLYDAHNALLAERNALAAELAAIRATAPAPFSRGAFPASECDQPESLGRCCLYTAYDKGFTRVAAYTVPAMRRYAQLYGFDFERHIDPSCDRPIAWAKLYLAREKFAEGYDTIFWVDADAAIRRFDEDIREHIDAKHMFYFVREEFSEGRVKSRLNSGIFVMRKSELTDRFLDAALRRDEFTKHVWWDQAAILATFGLWSNFGDNLHRADESNEFTEKLKFLPPRWNRFMGRDVDPDAIVRHFITLTNEAKAAALGIDTIFDEMGTRDQNREEHFREVVRKLSTMSRSKG